MSLHRGQEILHPGEVIHGRCPRPISLPINKEKSVGRASVPAALSGTGFPACASHRQDAGATKNFSEQLLMGLRPTRKA